MPLVNFLTSLHQSTARNYLERVARGDKAHCAAVAKRFGRDFWDGDRKYGYGGYKYDGRWKPVAQQLVKHYGLDNSSSVLDVGCGKAFLLYEIKQLLPGVTIRGIDVSDYALLNAPDAIRQFLDSGNAQALPYPDRSFDLIISLNALHNLFIFELKKALREIERVKKSAAWVVLESYRNEAEKENLLNWQLTCECFFTPQEWEWLFHEFGYTGDYGFIFFQSGVSPHQPAGGQAS